MPTGPARTTDDVADTIRSLVDRVVEAKFTKEMAARAAEAAELLAARGADAGERASEAWRDSEATRREAAKQVARARRDATRWTERTWRRAVRPALKDLWTRRMVAIGAAGAAVPVGRELVDQAAVRLGVKRREERHWGSFFLGLVLGAAAGIVAALLMAPKPGREIRRDLSVKAGEVADEIATRAREEWVPLFERDEVAVADDEASALEVEQPAASTTIDAASEAADASPTTAAAEAAADKGASVEQTADRAGDEAAGAINEAFEAEPSEKVEREKP